LTDWVQSCPRCELAGLEEDCPLCDGIGAVVVDHFNLDVRPVRRGVADHWIDVGNGRSHSPRCVTRLSVHPPWPYSSYRKPGVLEMQTWGVRVVVDASGQNSFRLNFWSEGEARPRARHIVQLMIEEAEEL
jgi:hypothetical protein